MVKDINRGLWQAGMEVIGWKEGREVVGGVKETVTKEMKAARGGRKIAHKAWKKSVQLGETWEIRRRNYAILKDWRAKVGGLEVLKNKRETQEFMDRVGRLGDQARSNKNFWQYWRTRVGRSQAPGSIRHRGEEFKTPEGIKGAMEAHFRELNTPHAVKEGDRERVTIEGEMGPEEREGIERSLMRDVTVEEVKENISKLKNRKATGMDKIPNEFLKRGGWRCGVCWRRFSTGPCEMKLFPKYGGRVRLNCCTRGGSEIC